MNRRQFQQANLLFALVALLPTAARARQLSDLFETTTVEEALMQLYQQHQLVDSDAVQLEIATRPESGALVPVTLACELPNVRSLSLFAIHNPTPIIAQFPVNPLIQAKFSLRIKLQTTTEVIAVAAADKLYAKRQKVIVTLGSCAA